MEVTPRAGHFKQVQFQDEDRIKIKLGGKLPHLVNSECVWQMIELILSAIAVTLKN